MTNIPSPAPSRKGAQPRSLRVGLDDRSYDILIGSGLIAEAGAHIGKALRRQRTVIVTEERVGALYLEPLSESLRAAGVAVGSIVLPPGESTKSFGHLETLCDRLLALEVERKDMVIALGGGVIGDLVGFAAAILRRGVDFIQVPTTLLAQVDSSVGGKTGINSRLGKNLIGAFHQPRLVLADTDTLGTLDRRELLAGYAEVLKYGLLGDADFFAWLEAHGPALLGGDMAARGEAIARCCQAKADIVARDEREHGERALLNLGHTFGHALEAEAGYDGRLLHGEGVAIGMAMAFYLSAKLGRCSEADARRAYDQIRASGLPTHPGERGIDIRPERMLDLMRQDKKVSDGRIAFILARGVGQAYIDKDVSDEDVIAALNAYLKDKAPAGA